MKRWKHMASQLAPAFRDRWPVHWISDDTEIEISPGACAVPINMDQRSKIKHQLIRPSTMSSTNTSYTIINISLHNERAWSTERQVTCRPLHPRPALTVSENGLSLRPSAPPPLVLVLDYLTFISVQHGSQQSWSWAFRVLGHCNPCCPNTVRVPPTRLRHSHSPMIGRTSDRRHILGLVGF